ncbi:MAG: hypothetical protein GX617_01020 [Lentisphaerae bacterium]|nr:hypothetical protein [Lentisphaeria bacterium]NLE53491.1 hypothetical protein [Lentisphaerota bacterium]
MRTTTSSTIDPTWASLPAGDGAVALAHALQGRIFCELGGEIVHRYDAALAAAPAPDSFNNIGGNSLWPGPEGGPYAFNYPPGNGLWYVQPAINSQPTIAEESSSERLAGSKVVSLQNRRGVTQLFNYHRSVNVLPSQDMSSPYGISSVAYRCVDELRPLNPPLTDDMLFCAWSLEQFPGGEGVIAFGMTDDDAAAAINCDYYGHPGDRLRCKGQLFRLALGGKDRFQIGIAHHSQPKLIGAYDPHRDLLIIRRISKITDNGLYFNIADNDQPRGPFSAADSYSIFNGGELDFFELETIAPLHCDVAERGTHSTLCAETLIFKGAPDRLGRCLDECFGIPATIIGGLQA